MKKPKSKVRLRDIEISNENKLIIIGGVNVIEDLDVTLKIAKEFTKVCNRLSIPLVFKASYDKANRSNINSYRGPGIVKGLEILSEIKNRFDVPILTDVHTTEEVEKANMVCDILQLPAFLARQTDLIKSLAKTKSIINIKKPQFTSPYQVNQIVNKFLESDNSNLLVCERGTCFGYDNLIVDMLGFGVIKKKCNNIPLIFDVTHSLQYRNTDDIISNGRRTQILELAKAGISTKLAGLFLEAHPNPKIALCDGPSALPLNLLEVFLEQIIEIDTLVKKQKTIEIN